MILSMVLKTATMERNNRFEAVDYTLSCRIYGGEDADVAEWVYRIGKAIGELARFVRDLFKDEAPQPETATPTV